jgi:hypothetical protein
VISHTALFWFLVVIASIVAEHYTGNILLKGNQFNTKVDYVLGVDKDCFGARFTEIPLS